MARYKRPVGMARVGNYIAPVDTTGMDPQMKATLGMGPRPREMPMPEPTKPAAPSVSQRVGGIVKTLTTELTKPFEPSELDRKVAADIAYARQRKVSPSHITSGNRAVNSTGNYRSPSTKQDKGR